jgi:N,N'-diacetyllegionaminate synthase
MSGIRDGVAPVHIGPFTIGTGRCFVIAEAGVNHNGDLGLAHQLIDAAADAKADAVKFQTWVTERICSPSAKTANYQTAGAGTQSQFDMLKALELPEAWHGELQSHAQSRGIMFLSTPDDILSARFLVQLGVPAIKVGSGELTNLPYLRELASLGLPIILSTGMGTMAEVEQAMTACQNAIRSGLAVLHCVSAYPAPEEAMNLRSIETLRARFRVPVGLSDHTMTSLAVAISVGVGMDILEKHLTLDRTMRGPDHAASAEPREFAELVKTVRLGEVMLGTGQKAPAEVEQNVRDVVRRVVVYREALAAGTVLREDHLHALRTGTDGFSPNEMVQLVGRVLRHSVSSMTPVAASDLDLQ